MDIVLSKPKEGFNPALLDTISQRDKEWFLKNPKEIFRVRPPLEGEGLESSLVLVMSFGKVRVKKEINFIKEEIDVINKILETIDNG